MNREKQIEEMANILWHIPGNYFLNSYNDCERIAECIYDDGCYRKQSEGEWIETQREWDFEPYFYTDYTCSVCGDREQDKRHFCPNCGAKMRGGAE